VRSLMWNGAVNSSPTHRVQLGRGGRHGENSSRHAVLAGVRHSPRHHRDDIVALPQN